MLLLGYGGNLDEDSASVKVSFGERLLAVHEKLKSFFKEKTVLNEQLSMSNLRKEVTLYDNCTVRKSYIERLERLDNAYRSAATAYLETQFVYLEHAIKCNWTYIRSYIALPL